MAVANRPLSSPPLRSPPARPSSLSLEWQWHGFGSAAFERREEEGRGGGRRRDGVPSVRRRRRLTGGRGETGQGASASVWNYESMTSMNRHDGMGQN